MNQRLVHRYPQEMISIILGLRGSMVVYFLKELQEELVAVKGAGI